jgi:tetratricopeptide (TPR) repeat protein
MASRCLASLALAAAVVSGATFAQQAPAADAAALRALFFQRDFETAAIEGARAPAAAPAELKAWHVLNMARASREDEAVEGARRMTAAAPQDGWAWFALAGALHYQGGHAAEAIAASEKAMQLLPGTDDAVWLRAVTLAGDSKRRDEAVAFIDSNRGRVKSPANLLSAKGSTLYSAATASGARDETKLKAAFEAFAEARTADPKNLNAHYLPGAYLDSQRRSDEAIPLLEQAVALAPASPSVHQAYWNALRGSQQLTAEQKTQRVMADLKPFVDRYGDRGAVLYAAASMARTLKDTALQQSLEQRILAAFNDTREAEWVLTYRIREFRTPEDVKKPEYRQMLRDYVARPRHYHTGLLGEMYRQLFFSLVEDESAGGDELLRVLDGMVKYEDTNIHLTHVASSIALANRKIHLEKAEAIARAAVPALLKRVERDRGFYTDAKQYEDRLKTAPAIGHDALGWVLFVRGKTEEAEKELLQAAELSPGNRDNLYHLGRFYEAKNDLAKAEEYYVKGLGVQSPGTNPSEAALQALFEKREGKGADYARYRASLTESERLRRREKVLGDRKPSPEPAAAFSLKSLDGKVVSLDSLKGKVVVINFWGIWCGWCVKEMPDLQKLHEQYKADPDVAILTIDNDRDPGEVPPWMKQRNFTFPVLIDDGYVDRIGVNAFPTTWFLDRDGRKAFVKVGWSEKLVEEFGWRIEAIRAGTTTAAR